MKLTLSKLFLAFSFGLFLTVSSAAFAQAKDVQQLSSDVSSLQKGLGKIEKDMNKLRRLLDNRALLELFQRMDELSEEVSNLRGMLEQQEHDLAGLKKRQRELYLDTDRRLRELEITSTRAPAPAQTPAAVLPQPEIASPPVQNDVPATAVSQSATPAGTKKPVEAVTPPVVQSGATRPASVSTPTKSSATMSEERAAYQKAFDMLKEGRYKMANASFLEFVGRYPSSSYAGNSQYWLGESNYVTRQFKQAIKEFKKVIERYPNSNKVPDAMLKLGYTYYELHEFDNARSVLTQLQKYYSKSTASRLARKRLDRMNKEGH
ncbi:MAG: tol-pal system protein YbgF [Gammaproteobacteria bacterium]|nr:tol-pal system protein YbgF [Gammaproteobacteria bacterium]